MTKKGLLAICTAIAVAGGTGSAIAAGIGALGTTKPTDNAWVQALAKKLGTTPDKLVEALESVSNDRIDALVAAGTITKAQADTLKARTEATGGLGLRGGFGPGAGFGHHGLGGVLGDPMATAATYLGMTRDALETALDGGKTLAAIAKEQGKTTDGLKAALLDDATTRIDSFIADAATPGHGRMGGMGGPGFGHRGGFGGGMVPHGMGHGRGVGLPGMGASGLSVDQLPAPRA